jgi:hypothetical protein
VLINVQSKNRDANGDLIATVLDGRGGTEELRLAMDADAAEVERVWSLSEFDLGRYAESPPEFPTPAAIPVEIQGPAQRITCRQCGHGVTIHQDITGCRSCSCELSAAAAANI